MGAGNTQVEFSVFLIFFLHSAIQLFFLFLPRCYFSLSFQVASLFSQLSMFIYCPLVKQLFTHSHFQGLGSSTVSSNYILIFLFLSSGHFPLNIFLSLSDGLLTEIFCGSPQLNMTKNQKEIVFSSNVSQENYFHSLFFEYIIFVYYSIIFIGWRTFNSN